MKHAKIRTTCTKTTLAENALVLVLALLFLVGQSRLEPADGTPQKPPRGEAAAHPEPSVLVTVTATPPELSTSEHDDGEDHPAPLELEPAKSLPQRNPARGRWLYKRKCAVCHGRSGDGKGRAARYMNPRPRDFTRATYRLRSTPTGSLPTDYDLFRTISRGMPGTAMPPWAGLSVSDRWQLVHYVKSLSPRFTKERPERPLHVPPPPPFDDLRVERGASIYRLMQCAECHGESGRGDGPAALTMKDDQEQPIYAFDFTRSWKLKNGRTGRDIYQVLATGLDGTPMPSYADTLAPRDLWDLAYYVRSLFVDNQGSE